MQERVLNSSDVNPGQFGKLFERNADGEIYAQPLFVPNLAIPGQGVHNVVFVVTMHDSVYAFDASAPAESAPLWHDNFGPSFPASNVQCCCPDISTEIGILSTPVIDSASKLMYVVSRDLTPDGVYHQWIHALDITTGKDMLSGPIEIEASYGGLTFDPKIQNQRPALLLSNGVVYVSWASHNDCGPYHGWIVAYNASTLEQVGVYCDTPNGSLGGFWQSGQGPTVDSAGNIYMMSGNGTFDANSNGPDLGMSFIKLSPAAQGMKVLDWFAPYNADSLNAGDMDLGSAGVLAIPGTNMIIGGGKEGTLYLLNKNHLGHFNPGGDSQIVQSFPASNSLIHGSPVYYRSPVNGPCIYLWGAYDNLKVFQFKNGLFNPNPIAYSADGAPGPGGMLSLSANGHLPGTAIIWALFSRGADAGNAVVPGELAAYDASAITVDSGGTPRLTKLWDSTMNPTQDDPGKFSKFCPPTIADGKVFVPNFGDANDPLGSGHLEVYGLLKSVPPSSPSGLTASPGDQQIALSWNPSSNAGSYDVYRGKTSGAERLMSRDVKAPFFTDSSATNGTTYYYYVTAANGAGQSAPSNEASAQPSISSGISYNLSPLADSYVSSSMPDQNFGALQTLHVMNHAYGSQEQAYLKFDLTGISGKITSSSLNLYGSMNIGQENIEAHSVPDVSWIENGITWNSKPASGGEIGTALVSSQPQEYSWNVRSYIANKLSEQASVISLAMIMQATYASGLHEAQFSSREGYRAPSLYVSIQSGSPPAPTNLIAAAQGNSVLLSWNAVPGAAAYNIYRAGSSGGESLYQSRITNPEFTDNSVLGGNTYYYEVTSTDSAGESVRSAEVSVTIQNSDFPDYPSGFAGATLLTGNGSASLNDSKLVLTDGGYGEAGSAWFDNQVMVREFHNTFRFQLTNAQADGFTFCIQGDGLNALGGAGGDLGYGSIPNSVAIKFDLYNNAGEGVDSTGLYINGASPTVPAIDLSNTGIDLHSGDIFQVDMTYMFGILTVKITDTQTNATATQNYKINIPGAIGGKLAYVGFTGGTGGLAARQMILSWVFTN